MFWLLKLILLMVLFVYPSRTKGRERTRAESLSAVQLFFFQLLFLFWCLFRFLLFPVSVSYVQLHSLYSSRQEERKPSHYRPWIFFDFFSCFEVFFDFFSQVIRFSYVFFIHQAQLDVFHFCYFRVQLNVNVKNINRIHIHI